MNSVGTNGSDPFGGLGHRPDTRKVGRAGLGGPGSTDENQALPEAAAYILGCRMTEGKSWLRSTVRRVL